ncbi:hypothetical protein [Pseudomonas aeruginosa]|uniref:hypothetical protein n=1 Tax=Pseudomonas aeruginosa TaxID=287 RepID=UPI001CA517E5|nr:hypothetical protein [Pseudomonas aeruginosa]MBW6071971.1 hypothetical protein [Pseudomonas aeruginosa]
MARIKYAFGMKPKKGEGKALKVMTSSSCFGTMEGPVTHGYKLDGWTFICSRRSKKFIDALNKCTQGELKTITIGGKAFKIPKVHFWSYESKAKDSPFEKYSNGTEMISPTHHGKEGVCGIYFNPKVHTLDSWYPIMKFLFKMISSGLDYQGREEEVHLKLAEKYGFWKSYLAMSFHGLIANGYTGYPLSSYMFSSDWDDLKKGDIHIQSAEESMRFGRWMANRDAPGGREWVRSTPWRSEFLKIQLDKVEVVTIAPQPTVFGKKDPYMTVDSEVGGFIRLYSHTCEKYGVVMLGIMGEIGWRSGIKDISLALEDFIEKNF